MHKEMVKKTGNRLVIIAASFEHGGDKAPRRVSSGLNTARKKSRRD